VCHEGRTERIGADTFTLGPNGSSVELRLDTKMPNTKSAVTPAKKAVPWSELKSIDPSKSGVLMPGLRAWNATTSLEDVPTELPSALSPVSPAAAPCIGARQGSFLPLGAP
jgi:hypothetical protein